jgi:hypothetical protein
MDVIDEYPPDLASGSGVCRACKATQAMMDEFNARTYDAGGPWTWADESRTLCRPCRDDLAASQERRDAAEAIDLLREWLAKFGSTIRVLCDGDLDRQTEEAIGAWERRAKGGAMARAEVVEAGTAGGHPRPPGKPEGGGGTDSPAAMRRRTSAAAALRLRRELEARRKGRPERGYGKDGP